ncbi:MAG: site-specific integrase [Pelagibacterium sp.]|uniref:site-specific integrase n=1 Tax=Pelagibacterium sp. TaxID=1967288 RepID=UPI0032EAD66F
MASESFLRLKGRTSYFRRKIPADLQSQLASREICFRLGVIDRDSAMLLARRLAVDVDAFFMSARRNKMLSSQDLSTLLKTAQAGWRESIRAVPIPQVSTRDQARTMASLADGVLHRQSDGFALMDDTFVAETFELSGIAPPSDPMAIRIARNALSTGMAAHYLRTAAELARMGGHDRGFFKLPASDWEKRAARLQGTQSDLEPVHPYADQREATAATVDRITATATTTPSASTIATTPLTGTKFDREAGPTFSTQAPYIVGERIKARQVGPEAVGNIGPSLRLWLQICGDADIRSYNVQHMAEFRSVLIDIPKIYWRSEAEQVKHILQVIVEAKATGPDYRRVSPKTINKHVSNMNSVFEYAKKIGVLERTTPNFAEGLYLESGIEVSGLDVNEERPGYTAAQIELFFSHPVYTGRKSTYFYNEPGAVIIRDALYWLPLLSCYQLMRREEICQLRVRHVRQEDGIWLFDLMKRDVKVKRPSSRRRVPLHDAIIRMGFLDDVVLGRDADELLFPELAPTARGSYSDAVGKRVGRMVDSLDIKLIRVDASEADGALHPFRHHGITYLENSEIKGGIIDGLSGHASEERKSERRRYTDLLYLTVLRDAINRLAVPVDVDALNAAWLASQKGQAREKP